jgi:hypothetical protein
MMLVENKKVVNKPNRLFLLAGLVFVFLLSFILNTVVAHAVATAPAIITYQGKLLVNGSVATTTQNLIITLYDSASVGTALYTASGTIGSPTTTPVIPVSGIFTVNLGDTNTNSIDPAIFQNNGSIYLEITINGQTLSPRKRITASPFAFNAIYLNGVAATSTASSSTYIPISDNSGNFNFNHVTSTGIAATGNSSFVTTTFNGYVGVGTTSPQAGLHVYDNTLLVDNTVNPTIAGYTEDITKLNGASSIYVSGRYAYVASLSGVFAIVDISNPATPTTTGFTTDATRLGALSVFVSGKYAYVASTIGKGLAIVDVSNPNSPTTVGFTSSTQLNGATSVYVSGKYAYMAVSSPGKGLAIIDVSNPTAPTTTGFMSNISKLNGGESVYVSGKYAYVTSYSGNSLAIIDISNPSAPTTTGFTSHATMLGGAQSVYVSGRYAYVASYNSNGIAIVDISIPSTPTTTGFTSDATKLAGAYSVYVSGRYAYVTAQNSNGLAIVDIINSLAPTTTGFITDAARLNYPNGAYVSGKYAYVVGYTGNSLAVVDLKGADISTANIGNVATNDLTVSENADIGNNLYVKNGLNVGQGGIYSQGAVTIASTTSSSLPLLTIYGGSGSTFSVDSFGDLSTSGTMKIFGNTTLVTTTITSSTITQLNLTNLFGVNATTTNLNATGLTFLTASGTSVTSTNGFFTLFNFTNANGGSVTSTNLAVTGALNVTGATIVGLNVNSLSGTSSLAYLANNQTFTGINTFSGTSTFASTSFSGNVQLLQANSTNNTDFLINPTTKTGSGLLFDAQVGGASKFSVRLDGVVQVSNEVRNGNLTQTTGGLRFGDLTSFMQIGGVSGSGTAGNSSGAEIDFYGSSSTLSGTALAGGLVFRTGTSTINNQNITAILNADGNFGIGTTVPSTSLHVVGSATISGTATLATTTISSSTITQLNLTNLSGVNATTTNLNVSGLTVLGSTTISSSTITSLNFISATGTNLYISSTSTLAGATFSGNVGIGTTTPAYQLHVYNASTTAGSNSVAIENKSSSSNAYFLAINDLGKRLFMGAYGSANPTAGYPNNAAFGSEDSMLIVSDAYTASGGTNKISFLTGGYIPSTQTRMTIDSNGNVGIGTTTPVTMFQVTGTSTFATATFSGYVGIGTVTPTSSLQIKGTGTNSTTNALNVTDSNGGSILFVRNDGVVSLGADPGSDQYNFQVHGNVGAHIYSGIRADSATQNAFYAPFGGMYLGGAGITNYIAGKLGIGTTTPAGLLQVGGSSPFTVTANGDVGIGTSTPDTYAGYTTLTINNNNNGSVIDFTKSGVLGGEFLFDNANNALTFQAQSTSSINFRTNGANVRMKIDSIGNVGIGTTSPQAMLFVQGAQTSTNLFTVVSSSGATLLTVLSNGNIGIGTTTPDTNLAVSGTIHSTGQILGRGTLNYALPDFSFSGQADMGIGYKTSNSFGMVSGGAERLRILGGGAVANIWLPQDISALQFGAAEDTALSRIGVAKIAVGSGTGPAGDYSGTLIASNIGIGTTTPQAGLHVYNNTLLVDNPVNPTIIGTAVVSSGPYGVYVSGKYAYVTNVTSNTMSIVDVSNPTIPVAIGTVTGLDSPYSVHVSGKYAYVVNTVLVGTMSVVDISDPTIPTIVGTATGLNFPISIYISGKYAYVANNGANTLSIIDISNPVSPAIVGTATGLNGPNGMFVAGKYAYVANGIGTMSVIDISNPASPSVVGVVAGLNIPVDIYVSGRFAYVVNSAAAGYMSVVDISSSTNPVIIATTTVLGSLNSVFVSGKYAYVANYNSSTMSVIDISSSTRPVIVGTATGLNLPADIYISGKYAYLANNGNGTMSIVDLKGADISTANIGNIATNDLTVYENMDVGNNLYVKNGLNVGQGGIYSQGAITIASTTLSTLPLLTIYGGSGSTFSVDSYGNISSSGTLQIFGNTTLATTTISSSTITQLNFTNLFGVNATTTNHYNSGLLTVAGTSTFATATFGGYVGIGTTSPQAGAHVYNNTLLVDSPVNPTTTGFTNNATMFGNAVAVYVSGKYAYSANSDGILAIVDISNPLVPTTTGFVSDAVRLGSASSVFVSGKYAYVASGFNGQGIAVVDVSNPVLPTIVGYTSDSQLGNTQSVYVSGKYAYLASYNKNGLAVVDISNPVLPTVIGFTSSTSLNSASAVYVSGKYAYVASQKSNGLAIINIADPSAPTTTGFTSSTELNNAKSVYVSGKYAYVTAYGSNNLVIINIADPSAPTTTGFTSSTQLNKATSVQVSGKYAYIASYGANGLAIVDVSNPSNPVVTGFKSDAASLVSPRAVFVSGKYAYLVAVSSFAVVDIKGADISTANIGNIATNDLTVWENADIGNNLYVKNGLNVGVGGIMSNGAISVHSDVTSTVQPLLRVSNGTLLVDNPVNPTIVGTATGLGGPDGVYISGKYAYVANSASNTMSIIDISNPANPLVISSTVPAELSAPTNVFVVGNYAYLTDSSGYIKIYDISNPASPAYTGITGTNFGKKGLYISGRYAYVIGGANSVEINDISNISNPAQISSINTAPGPQNIYVSGKYAYVTIYNGGAGTNLVIINISNPNGPTIATTTAGFNGPFGIYVSGKYAYVTNNTSNTMSVVDISNPTSPAIVGTLSGLGGPREIYVSGKYAYVTNYASSTVSVIDISSSTNPLIIGTVSGLGSPNGIFISGKYAYVTNSSTASMSIIDLKGADISTANIGNIATNDLTVWENADIGNNLYVKNGINAGVGGFYTSGQLSVYSTSSFYGWIGLNTATPLAALHIASSTAGGNARIDNGWLCVDTDGTCTGANTAGTVYAVSAYTLGADLAENYISNEALEPGDVVQVDPQNPLYVIKTASTYSATMLGIISTKPGVLLNRQSTSSYPVALAGKVPVRVSLENGPINSGDKLTSGSVPGTAMKATADGATIAIALESYDSSSTSTTIMAFVHLGWNSTLLNSAISGTSVTTTATNSGSLLTDIISALKQFGITIQQGVIEATEFIANKMTTNELCVGQTCVTEAQLKELLVKNQIQPASSTFSDLLTTTTITTSTEPVNIVFSSTSTTSTAPVIIDTIVSSTTSTVPVVTDTVVTDTVVTDTVVTDTVVTDTVLTDTVVTDTVVTTTIDVVTSTVTVDTTVASSTEPVPVDPVVVPVVVDVVPTTTP